MIQTILGIILAILQITKKLIRTPLEKAKILKSKSDSQIEKEDRDGQ